MVESCETKISNLLASMDNLPEGDADKKFAVLVRCIELQAREIERVQEKVNHP